MRFIAIGLTAILLATLSACLPETENQPSEKQKFRVYYEQHPELQPEVRNGN